MWQAFTAGELLVRYQVRLKIGKKNKPSSEDVVVTPKGPNAQAGVQL